MVTDFHPFLLGDCLYPEISRAHPVWPCEPDSLDIWSLPEDSLLRFLLLCLPAWTQFPTLSSAKPSLVAGKPLTECSGWQLILSRKAEVKTWLKEYVDSASCVCRHTYVLQWTSWQVLLVPESHWGGGSVLICFMALIPYWGTVGVNRKQPREV